MANMTEKQAMARCGDCEFCVNNKGKKMCGEMLTPRPIVEVGADECPLGIELAEIEVAEKKAKANKIQHGAKDDTKEKKPRKPRPVDVEKVSLVEKIQSVIAEFTDNCVIINKNNEIGFDFGGDNYSIKVVKHRKPKK